MSTTVTGTSGEDRSDYTNVESKAIRKRSTRLLVSLIAPLKWWIVLAAALVLVSTALEVAGPRLIAAGIDTGLPNALDGNFTPLAIIAGVFAFAAAASAVLIWAYIKLAQKITETALLELRTRLFRHTQRLSLEFHESYTSGRIISRQTSDVGAFRELLSGGLQELVQGVVFITFTFIALTLTDWRAGVILLCAGIPIGLLMRWFYKRSQVAYRQSTSISAKVIVQFVETMTGIRAVKAFRKEPRNDVSFAAVAGDYRNANLRVLRMFGTFEPGIMAIAAITTAAVLLSGGLRVSSGALAVGVLLATIMYVRNFFGPLQDIAMFLNSYQSAAAALEKISGVLEEEPTVRDPENPVPLAQAQGALTFDRVGFGYTADRMILPEFSLEIPAGQTVALVGTTGAGKTTLAKLVSRFYDPIDGAVKLDGVDLRDLSPADLRRAIVMVTQEAYLFSGTVAENIALGKPDATIDEIEAAAIAVGAHEFISALPDGYSTDVNKRGGRVSAGQRQLISFARAFLADPAVLILDEATASLDMPSERQIQHALETLLSDRTAIIIAHRLSTVAIADRVLVMEHGRVIEDDTPENLIGGTGKFAQLHAAWLESLA